MNKHISDYYQQQIEKDRVKKEVLSNGDKIMRMHQIALKRVRDNLIEPKK